MMQLSSIVLHRSILIDHISGLNHLSFGEDTYHNRLACADGLLHTGSAVLASAMALHRLQHQPSQPPPGYDSPRPIPLKYGRLTLRPVSPSYFHCLR